MNVSLIVNALLSLLAAAPHVIEDINTAISDHWGKDHVQQAVKGVEVLNTIIKDIAPAATAAEAAAGMPVQATQS